MARIGRNLATLAVFSILAEARFTEIFFNNSPNSTACPGEAFGCQAPLGVCAYDRLLGSYFCCEPNDTDGACWHGSKTCGSSDTLSCGSGQNSWCCAGGGYEKCTQTAGQVNICWATETNPLGDITSHQLNETYSSLLAAASPGATALPLNVTSLAAATSTATSTRSTSSTTSSTSQSSPVATNSYYSNSTSQPGLSTGAIGGIIAGIVGILIAVIVFFVIRSRRRPRPSAAAIAAAPAEAPENAAMAELNGFYAPADRRHPNEKARLIPTVFNTSAPIAHELNTGRERAELPAQGQDMNAPALPVELSSARMY